MRFAARAGYHPDGIVHVMQMLDDVTREHGGAGPEFLSTHPNPGNRVGYLNDQIRKEYPSPAGTRNRPEYDIAMVDMREKQPAYELADKGDEAMGAGIKAQGEGNREQARAEYRRALKLYNDAAARVPAHSILWVNVAQAQFYLEEFENAERTIQKALRLDRGGFWPNFMGGLIAARRNDNVNTVPRLEAALRLIPESPVGMFYLAVGYDRQQRKGDAVSYYKKAYDSFGGEGQLAEAARLRLIDLGQPDPKAKPK
jgi:predicted Zn-dependent protease